MASAGDSIGDQHLAVPAADDTYGGCMSATHTDLVSQLTADINALDNAIHIAEALLADAPADFCIPAGCFENLSIIRERRYQHIKDLDDLQTAITWAELGTIANPRDGLAQERLSKLITYLASPSQQTGNPDDLSKAGEHVIDTMPTAPQDIPILNSKRPHDSIDENSGSRKRVKQTVETPSLNLISAMLTGLVSQLTSDVVYLNNAIQFAEEVIMNAPADHCIPADIFKNLSVLYQRRYQQTKELDDLQTAISWAEQGADVTPRNMDQVHCLSNLISYLVARYERTGELENLREARKRITEIPDANNILLSSYGNFHRFIILKTLERFKAVYEITPLGSLDSISATISDLASQRTDDPNC